MPHKEFEFQKLIFETFQLLTTLNAAVAVIVPTVAKTLKLNILTSLVALVFFAASVICSAWGMWRTAERVKLGANGAPTDWLLAAWVLIIMGVAIFSIFTLVEYKWGSRNSEDATRTSCHRE